MAVIKASCSGCGDVELRSRDLMARVCRDTNVGTYCFACPRCHKRLVRAAEPRIIALLVESGVKLVTWSLPDELHEEHFGPVIDHDDILDLHLLLQRDDWMDDLVRTAADSGLRGFPSLFDR